MSGIKYALRRAVGRPITNREHEMSKGIDSAVSYAHFEFVAMQCRIAYLTPLEQMDVMKRYNDEWCAWLAAPYEPGKVFAPTYKE